MPKNPEPKNPENNAPKGDSKDSARPPESPKRDLGRRDFVKLVGGTGVAITTAGVLAGVPTTAEAQDNPPRGKVVGPAAVSITLKINGQPRKLTIEPRVTLIDALRNHLDLTGAKKVCDRANCGACTVQMNGKAVYSCTVLAIDAAMMGADIRTIEGLAPEGQMHPISAAFVANDAQQCGFCTSGFVMAAKSYLDATPHPTIEEAQQWLGGGNICRCGTYHGLRRAVVMAGGGSVPAEGAD
jgi:xanthine dehydrogenase YagT iron-sulfur-binding subunit